MIQRTPNLTHRTASAMKSFSVVLITAAELQADGPAAPVAGLQLTAIAKALLKGCIACHLLRRGPAAYLLQALAAEPSGSPAHPFPPCTQVGPAFSGYFNSCLCRAPFLSPFLPHHSGWASCHSRLSSMPQTTLPPRYLTYARVWERKKS